MSKLVSLKKLCSIVNMIKLILNFDCICLIYLLLHWDFLPSKKITFIGRKITSSTKKKNCIKSWIHYYSSNFENWSPIVGMGALHCLQYTVLTPFSLHFYVQPRLTLQLSKTLQKASFGGGWWSSRHGAEGISASVAGSTLGSCSPTVSPFPRLPFIRIGSWMKILLEEKQSGHKEIDKSSVTSEN